MWGREWAAETVVGVFQALYARSWGHRMTDLLRAACLTLAGRAGSTLPDVLRLLTEDPFREQVLTQVGTPAGLGNVWGAFDRMSVGARENLAAPLTSRLRGLFSRRFARDLLTPNTSTFDLGQVLDGGILLARLPKGELGEDTTRLVGSLLVGSLWAHTTRRATRPPDSVSTPVW